MNQASPPAVRFSMFDWLDESGRGFAQTYDERLKLLEVADRAGYYSYLLAEHHGTSLSTTPSPSLFLSAAAQRTERLRLGALTWCLPLYNPLRLLEELCMLDQLCHGRLEIGISRGASPHEGLRHFVPREESRDRFEEVLALLVMGFTKGELDFNGRYYRYDQLKTRLRTIQQPYPPLWCPTSNIESIPWIAAQGLSTVVSLLHSASFSKADAMLKQYQAELKRHRHEPGRLNAHVAVPQCAFTTHIYVADTDAIARDEARVAYSQFHENYTRRYVEIGQADKYANRPSFDQFVADSLILCGSPDTVRDILGSHLRTSGANHFIGAFTFGSLTFEQTKHSLELFAREVMSALAHVQAAVA